MSINLNQILKSSVQSRFQIDFNVLIPNSSFFYRCPCSISIQELIVNSDSGDHFISSISGWRCGGIFANFISACPPTTFLAVNLKTIISFVYTLWVDSEGRAYVDPPGQIMKWFLKIAKFWKYNIISTWGNFRLEEIS